MRSRLLIYTYLVFHFFSCQNNTVEWPVYLGDKGSSHYSSLRGIDTNNVSALEVAWVYHTGDLDTNRNSQIQCNPIIVNGVLYGTSPQLKLFALDAATGKEKWVFDPFENSETEVQINVNRGVTYWSAGEGGRIFYSAGAFLYCVSAETGRLMTSFGNNGRIDLRDGLGRDASRLYVTATSPGMVYRDLLIMGSRVAETNLAAPGDIRAYNVHTGNIEWVFHTIPRPGELGNDTWEDDEAWKHTGGANNWAGMSLDEERGMVYIPTGSATFDFYGGNRKGENLFSNCVLALDAATGKLVWYYQTIHHDLWDRDLPAPPNLVTIKREGKESDAVVQVTKTGYVFVLDRDSGKPLFPVHERPVPHRSSLIGEQPWPTQPVPELPEPFVKQRFTAADINDLVPDSSQKAVRERLAQFETGHMFLPPSEQGMVMYPGFDGGAEWGGAAYDPTTNFLYINANQVPWTLQMVKTGAENKADGITMAEHGKAVYTNSCMSCHGIDKKGNGDFPSLMQLDQKYKKHDVLQIINNGSRRMPSFEQLSPVDKEALLAFLLDLEEGGQSFSARNNKKEPGYETEVSEAIMPYTMTGYQKLLTPEGYPASKPPWGNLTAIDLNSGKIVWQIPLGEYRELVEKGIPITGTENYGGPIATAGGLLFIAATPDGKFRAFNKNSGELLWETMLPAAGFATPSAYMVKGKQYIVIACGGGKLGAHSGDTYIAFALPD